jgi:phosphatidylglycerophosphatase A
MKKNFLYKIIGTGLGLGLIPLAPGTFGALGGLLTGLIILQYSLHPAIVLSTLIVLFFFIGVYCAGKHIPEWGNDPSRIVIDEIVGMWIAMIFIPNDIILILSAFAAFRFFDIEKPLLIKEAERFRGGWGIMLDDVAAGMLSNVIVHLFIFIKLCFFHAR